MKYLGNTALNNLIGKIKTLILNIVNGSSEGSIRSVGATEESSNYTMGIHSIAFGLDSTASGGYSVAIGRSTKASISGATAIGFGSQATGAYSTALHGGTASGNTAFSAGGTASGSNSFSSGASTKAIGNYSSAQNNGTIAQGRYSHAEGWQTTANGQASHAEGFLTIASGTNQHVQGKYNIEDTSSKYAHIIGNGTSTTARSNAHTVDWDGNCWYKGDIKVRGTSYDDADTLVSSSSITKIVVVDEYPEVEETGVLYLKKGSSSELYHITI